MCLIILISLNFECNQNIRYTIVLYRINKYFCQNFNLCTHLIDWYYKKLNITCFSIVGFHVCLSISLYVNCIHFEGNPSSLSHNNHILRGFFIHERAQNCGWHNWGIIHNAFSRTQQIITKEEVLIRCIHFVDICISILIKR